MLFTETTFLFAFLPALLLLFRCAPLRARNLLLLVASLVFYAWGAEDFVIWLIGSIAVNYGIALAIERWRGTPSGKLCLGVGIASDLALLILFKYVDFGIANLNWLLSAVHLDVLPTGTPVLPLGISFFTFHKISYKVDVYRGAAKAERDPLRLALYILFFPQLIAGPIVRYHEIAAQLGASARVFRRSAFARGVTEFLIGLGKKMILANTVALTADQIFALPAAQLTPPVAWLGIFCYTLQIYFDFAGYSDMAVGLARMFGFDFPANFNYPYVATSVTDFWRRWHISLSRWFRDYLYLPLGGNRCHPLRVYLNLVTVFFLCGLWHGASWNFVIWGLFHGVFLVLERLGGNRWLSALPRPLRHAYTLFVVMIGWVFFRAASMSDAIRYMSALAGLTPVGVPHAVTGSYLDRALFAAILAGMLGSTPLMPALRAAAARRRALLRGNSKLVGELATAAVGGLALALILLASAMLIAAGTYNPFIYFRF